MSQSDKPSCKYGAKCYRKNPQHFEEFSHGEMDKKKKSPLKEADKSPDKEPPKKKAKIDDFFKAGNKEKSKVIAESDQPDGKTTAKEDDRKGCTSGYVRESEAEASLENVVDEIEDAPPSPTDVAANIKSKFLVDMPKDFYSFWEFAKSINSTSPRDAFKKTLGLQLVGPFDVLAKRTVKKNSEGKTPCYLRHWRYYYDPPEFLTIVRGDDHTQFHLGYFRDDPQEMPAFVASNAAKDNWVITPRGENLFIAISWFIDDKIKKDGKNSALTELKNKLVEYAKSNKFSLDLRTKGMKERDKKMNCKTFHGAGMVVPVDANDVGYREVPETPADLKKMFKKIVDSKDEDERNKNFDPLMEIIMLVQFANDECDYGEGLELGLDLFSYGGKVFHQTILNLLPLAYQLLGRHEYKDIIEAHLKDRKHSADLDELK